MSQDVFSFDDYKIYLNSRLDELDEGGRGSRARMSRAIGCQTAYTTLVLRGHAHFNSEQIEAINEFLGHTEEQGAFLLLLLQHARAGSPSLRARYLKQMNEVQAGRLILKNRLGIKEGLGDEERVTYYSAWFYSAIHALVSIPNHQSVERISDRLNINRKQVSEALEFLLSTGLIERRQNGKLKTGKGQIHLGSDSPLIGKHHINWRLQAIRAIEGSDQPGLHYSSVITISEHDAKIIHEKLIETIKDLKVIVRESKEEKLCALAFDFFPL